jgi:hypothetical protein
MKRTLALLLTAALLFITAYQLPAPIQEVQENPTPAQANSPKPNPSSDQTVRRSAERKRNEFSMIEGKYTGQTETETFALKSDRSNRTAIEKIHSNYFVITGNRFTFIAHHVWQPNALGVSGGIKRASWSERWRGVIRSSGDGTYSFHANTVELIDKNPKDLTDERVGFGEAQKLLRRSKWTLRYDQGTLIQPTDGKVWELE